MSLKRLCNFSKENIQLVQSMNLLNNTWDTKHPNNLLVFKLTLALVSFIRVGCHIFRSLSFEHYRTQDIDMIPQIREGTYPLISWWFPWSLLLLPVQQSSPVMSSNAAPERTELSFPKDPPTTTETLVGILHCHSTGPHEVQNFIGHYNVLQSCIEK